MHLLHLLTFFTKRWWSRYILVGSVGVQFSLHRRLLMTGFRQFVLLHILQHLAVKLFRIEPLKTNLLQWPTEVFIGGVSKSRTATRVTWHCCFCCVLMHSISSSKHNTGDYQGHEGDVMHHLVQTNWTVSLWRDQTRTRTNHITSASACFLSFYYYDYIYIYIFTHLSTDFFVLKDAVKDISFTHHWDFICGWFILMQSKK